MNRNVTILIIVLIILLLAGYLLWLRARFQSSATGAMNTPTPQVTVTSQPTPTSQIIGSPSAIATKSGKITPTVIKSKNSTGAGSQVK